MLSLSSFNHVSLHTKVEKMFTLERTRRRRWRRRRRQWTFLQVHTSYKTAKARYEEKVESLFCWKAFASYPMDRGYYTNCSSSAAAAWYLRRCRLCNLHFSLSLSFYLLSPALFYSLSFSLLLSLFLSFTLSLCYALSFSLSSFKFSLSFSLYLLFQILSFSLSIFSNSLFLSLSLNSFKFSLPFSLYLMCTDEDVIFH